MSNEAQNWAWKVTGISAYEKLVLVRLADHADGDHTAFPGKSSLATATCMNKRSVDRIILRLEAFGLISIEHREGDSRRARSNRYHLHLEHLEPVERLPKETATEPSPESPVCATGKGGTVPGVPAHTQGDGRSTGITAETGHTASNHDKSDGDHSAPSNALIEPNAGGCHAARDGIVPGVVDHRGKGVLEPGAGVAPCRGEGGTEPPESSLNPQGESSTESSLSASRQKKSSQTRPRLSQPKPGGELPTDWVLSKSWADMARSERPGITDEQIRITAANFRDYFLSREGSDRTCRDWPARWRRWVRSEKFDRHPDGRPAKNSQALKLPRNDDELPRFASQNQLPAAKPGESFREYRIRLDRTIAQGARA